MARISFTGATRFADAEAARLAAVGAGTPVHVHIIPNGNIVWVMTGSDAPASLSANDVKLSRMQLYNGALVTGGQPLLVAFEAYAADRIANGTPVQRIYWRDCNEFTRNTAFINQLRVAIQGAKTNPVSLKEMDDVFINGSGYAPATT